MSASTTQARRGIRGERLTVLTVLLGMLLSLVAVLATAQPAFADSSCEGLDGPAGRVFERFEADLTRTSGTEGLGNVSVDTDSDDVSCIDTGNAVAIYLVDDTDWGGDGDPIQIKAVDIADAPDLHLSCSESYEGESFTIGASTYTASNTYLTISSAPGDSGKNCTERAEVSLSVGECEFTDDTSTYPATYSLTINEGDTPFSLWADGVKIDEALTEGTDEDAGDFAPGTELEIQDGNGVVVASDTVPEADCEPVDTVDAVASLSVGECVFDDEDGTSTYPATYSLTVNDGTGPFTLFVDGEEDSTLTGAEDESLGNFAPGTALEIREGDEVLASADVPEGTCEPDPEVQPNVLEKDPAPEPEPEPEPAPEVEPAAEELPVTGLEDGLLPLSLLLIAIGGALLWLDRRWVGVR